MTAESGEVHCHTDGGEDVIVPYEREAGGDWRVFPPADPEWAVDGTASERTVRQLIRKDHDDHY